MTRGCGLGSDIEGAFGLKSWVGEQIDEHIEVKVLSRSFAWIESKGVARA